VIHCTPIAHVESMTAQMSIVYGSIAHAGLGFTLVQIMVREVCSSKDGLALLSPDLN
jgi:hypothetical protein